MKFNWQHFFNRAGPVTIALVVISTLVSLLSWWGTNELTSWFLFQKSTILEGQLHRLISPIFLHFLIAGLPIHLLFNMMWLWDLGGSIEKAKSNNYLLILVLIIGVVSNLAQYLSSYYQYGDAADLVRFGGMSGVVYGLLGFIYFRRRFDPFFPVRINDAIMQFMLIWLVLGFVGVIGSVANGAHLMGLITGSILGYATAKTKRF